ncbi:helix-turn-helix transcriptional regulator [Planotetraspora kaengkrachanensis]|uniref:Transcriptional regulator n=1 Tax=Planotetraspora kaengkrachanensis TaxID=575193 RepID=A0A8J3LTY7_9ACTN|nr:helix-turn-helix transcriptional regulator [Planotetraspora kaengkrachanensis]GIG77744.1 transcriptional regulator [Planotetraspora kaengkrachanensis]
MDRLTNLGVFLQSCRARLGPEDVGIKADRPRRVRGLRREEVSRLADVSVEYYTRLEQARSKNASPAVLDSISRALRLNEIEHAHLFALAGISTTGVEHSSAQGVQAPSYELLDNLDQAAIPSCVVGRYLDVLAVNRMYRCLMIGYDDMPARERNVARFTFLNEASRELYGNWPAVARNVTGLLRFTLGRHPDDPKLNELINELLENCQDFRPLWADYNVQIRMAVSKHFHHPIVGDFTITCQALSLPATSDQLLFVFTAEPGSPSEAALKSLSGWAQTRRWD